MDHTRRAAHVQGIDDIDDDSAQAAITAPSSLDALLTQADNARKTRSLAKNAKANSFISKLIEFAKTVDTFSQSIDVYVQGSGAISAIIWGSIRVVIKAILNHAQIHDKISSTLLLMSENLARYQRYQTIFARSKLLQESIGRLYNNVAQFATQVARFYSQSRLRILVSGFLGRREYVFDEIISGFQQHNELVRDQVLLAYFEVDRQRSIELVKRRHIKIVRELSLWLKSDSSFTIPMDQHIHPGTCEWILQYLTSWIDTPTSYILWLKGLPGCGKSTLAAFVTNHLKQSCINGEEYVLSVSCQQNEQIPTSSTILRVLLHSILMSQSNVPQVLELLVDVKRSCEESLDVQAVTDILWHGFRSIIELLPFQRIFVLIDGIDALLPQNQERFLQNVPSLCKADRNSGGRFRMILTSRFYSHFREHQMDQIVTTLHINADMIHSDIELFLQDSLASSPRTMHLDSERRSELVSKLVMDCGGVFSYAVFHFQELDLATTDLIIRYPFDSLPAGLNDMFRNIAAPVISQSQGRLICQIVAAAVRPLKLQEIELLLEVDLRSSGFSPSGSRMPFENFVHNICGPLLIVKDDCAEFFHIAVKECLISSADLDIEESHRILGARCLDFASSKTFGPKPGNRIPEAAQFISLTKAHPFLDYAVRSWSYHFIAGKSHLPQNNSGTAVKALQKTRNLVWMEGIVSKSISPTRELEEYLIRNMDGRKSVSGVDQREIISATLQVAFDARKRGKILIAEKSFCEIVSYQEFCSMANDEQYQILSALALCYTRQSRWEEAENKYLLCLDLCSTLEDPALKAIQTQNSLAWAVKAQRRLPDALKLYKKIYVAAKAHLGLGHSETRLALGEIAALYEREGKPYLSRVVLLLHTMACRLLHGSAHSSTSMAFDLLVAFWERQANNPEAETTFREIFDWSKRFGEPDMKVGQVLAKLYEEKNDIANAGSVLEFLSSSYTDFNGNLEYAFQAHTTLAGFYIRHNQPDKAYDVLSLCKRLSGKDLNTSYRCRLTLMAARCEESLGNPAQAQKEYQALFDDQKETVGWSCRSIMNIGNELAAHYERQQQWHESLHVYEQIHEGFMQVLGERHRYTITAKYSLANFAERRSEWLEAKERYKDITRSTAAARGWSSRRVNESQRKQLVADLHALKA